MNERTETHGRTLPLLILLALLTATATTIPPQEVSAQGLPPDPARHPPIHIDGDAGFLLPGSGVTGGIGTEDDPFVISGWTIRPEYRIGPVDMSDDEAGIRVENTEMHYRIENITISGAFLFGIWLDGSAGHAHIADTTITGEPERTSLVFVAGVNSGAPAIDMERIIIEMPGGFYAIGIGDSPRVSMEDVVVMGTEDDGKWGAISIGAKEVSLRNIHLNRPQSGLHVEAEIVHLQGINVIDASQGHLHVDAANVTAQDITVLSPSWTPRDIVDIKASVEVRLRAVQANGNIRIVSGGGLVSLEDVLAVDANHGQWGGEGIRIQGVRDLVASGVEAYGFNRRGGLSVEGDDRGHWSLDSVHIEVEDARLNLHGGATVEAEDIVVRGGNIDINGTGDYKLRNALVEGGGITARGAGIDLSIEDSVVRAGNRIDGYGAGIEVRSDGEAPAAALVLKNTRVQDNFGGALHAGNMETATLQGNTFENNIRGFVAMHGLCSFIIEENRFVFPVKSTYGGLLISQGRAFSTGHLGSDVETCTHFEGDETRLIAGNTFEGAPIGLAGWASHSEIRDNTFTDQDWHGMKFRVLTDSIVADNTITGAGVSGIRVWAEDRVGEGPDDPIVTVWDDIARNTFTGNRITATSGEVDDISGAAGGDGMVLAGIDNTIEGNWFEDHAGYGLVVLGQDNRVDGNTFSGNGKGEIAHKLDPGAGNGTRQDTPTPGEHETPGPGAGLLSVLAIGLVATARRRR